MRAITPSDCRPPLVMLGLLAVARVAGQTTPCHHAGGADLIVSDIQAVANHARVGDVDAYSFGNVYCNLGDDELDFMVSTNRHPVLSQAMFRMAGGRFEQIGMSWVRHGFFALSSNQCGCGCTPTNGSTLGIGCSSPESAGINAGQLQMGPRSDVNAINGSFLYPPSIPPMLGNAVFRRLQVHVDDLAPNLNPDARYYVELYAIAPDDAVNGFTLNNASHRQVNIITVGNDYNAALAGSTQRELPAIRAWKINDSEVVETDVQIPGEGLLILAARARHLGDGVWNYEYAVHNFNSDRSARGFNVPVPSVAQVTDTGFHDVGYHSGEIIDGTDWPATRGFDALAWATDTFANNPLANAIRFGTLYNFRFNVNRPPVSGNVVVDLFKPGIPDSISAVTVVPAVALGDSDMDGDGDLADYAELENCLLGPFSDETGPPCMVYDHDLDFDVDLEDFASFAAAFTGG